MLFGEECLQRKGLHSSTIAPLLVLLLIFVLSEQTDRQPSTGRLFSNDLKPIEDANSLILMEARKASVLSPMLHHSAAIITTKMSNARKNPRSHHRALQLVPMTPSGSTGGRPLPLELGRVELVRWWVTNCCVPDSKKKEKHRNRSSYCDSCQSVMSNAKYMSKAMLSLDGDARRMIVRGKNVEFVYVNGRAVSEMKKARANGIPFANGDVLSFRSDGALSSPWMQFQVSWRESHSIVTPEKEQKQIFSNQAHHLRGERGGSSGSSCSYIQDDEIAQPINERNETSSASRSTSKRKREEVLEQKSGMSPMLGPHSSSSRRKLFVTPQKGNQCIPGGCSPNVPEEEEFLYHTQKEPASTTHSKDAWRHDQTKEAPMDRHPTPHSTQGSESSKMLSLPSQFPTCEEYDSDGYCSIRVDSNHGSCSKLGIGGKVGQERSPVVKSTPPIHMAASLLPDDTPVWQPASSLTRLQCEERLHSSTKSRTPGVCRALFSLILAKNKRTTEKENNNNLEWLPELLDGAMIRKS